MHSRDDASSIEWVGSDAALRSAVSSWGDRIALDTEFMRTNTYFPAPGLYQIAAAGQVYLVDPLAIDDWSPLKDVLTDAGVTKIMHACLEDLELIHHHLGVAPRNVFDTQYAQAFVSEHFSLSYAALVSLRLDTDLKKDETRSNWTQRPLSEDQVLYAMDDVIYLEALYDRLYGELDAQGKLDWFHTDMTSRECYAPNDPHEYYRNLKKAWQLRDQQLATLQALCAWRELTARQENVPRNRVVWDDHLFNFARRDRLRPSDVFGTLPRMVAKRYCEDLMAEHQQSRAASEVPEPLPRPLTSREGAALKALKNVGAEIAQRLELAPELICRKRDLEACVRHYVRDGVLPEAYADWRGDVVGEDYRVVLSDTLNAAPGPAP